MSETKPTRTSVLQAIDTKIKVLALICLVLEAALLGSLPMLPEPNRFSAFAMCTAVLVIMIIGIFVIFIMEIRENRSTRSQLAQFLIRSLGRDVENMEQWQTAVKSGDSKTLSLMTETLMNTFAEHLFPRYPS